MSDDFGTPLPPPVDVPKKRSNTALIIIIIVLVVLCCCCLAIGSIGWSFGDSILNSLGIYY
jgi:hypothetical protein